MKTRQWSDPGDTEIHWIEWDGLLPPPPSTPHVSWCTGCRLERYKAVAEAAQQYVDMFTEGSNMPQAWPGSRLIAALAALTSEQKS